jgi:hypothetical protein
LLALLILLASGLLLATMLLLLIGLRLLLVLSSLLLILLSRGLLPCTVVLLLLPLLILLASGLLRALLLLFLSRSLRLLLTLWLLFRSLRLLLSFRLCLLLLRGPSLFFRLLLPRIGWSCDSQKQEHSDRAHYCGSFHLVPRLPCICLCAYHSSYVERLLVLILDCNFACYLWPCLLLRNAYVPTRIREREWNNPKTFSSHNTTPMTTTPFKIDLMLRAMGMKRFTSQSRIPTTIRVIRI